MAPVEPGRRGALLILVAGLAGILAALALGFAYVVRGDTGTSLQMAKQAQTRILLHMAMGVALKQYAASGALADLVAQSPIVVQDRDTPASWNGAWISFRNPQQGMTVVAPIVPAYAIDVVVGAGPSQGATVAALGSFSSATELASVRSGEPRAAYRLNFFGALPADYVITAVDPIAIP